MKRIQKLAALLVGFLAVAGMNLLYGIRTESTMFSNSVLCMLVFVTFLFLVYDFFKREPDRRTLLFGMIGGLFFAAMTCFGFSLHYMDTIWHRNTLLAVLCLMPFFGICTGYLLLAVSAGNYQSREGEADVKWFLLCWGLLFLSWVPVWLASWPGIFSYDCGWQLVTYVEGTVNGHHPILHTWLLGITRDIGLALFGTNNAGAAIYTGFQMLAMSGMYAYVCWYLKKKCAPLWLRMGTFLFLAFHPTNSLMALCATKDSIFGALAAVFFIQVLEMAENREEFFSSPKRQIRFCLLVFLLFAFRNNAFHMFLLCVPFFLWIYRAYWKRMAALLLICLCFQGIYTGPVYAALGIEKGDPREKYSALMQSAARVYNLDYEGLTEEERTTFLSIIEEEGMRTYIPRFADTVKAYFNGKAFEEDPTPFLKAWLSVGWRHKKMYVDSFLINTYGYWYPGNFIEETDKGKDYFEYDCKEFQENIDVTMESKLPALSEFYRKIGNEASFQKVPVVSVSFSLGAFTWLLLFAGWFLLYRKQYGRLMPVILLFMYFVTNLLGPVVKMRYHYPLIVCAPLVILLILEAAGGNRETGGHPNG